MQAPLVVHLSDFSVVQIINFYDRTTLVEMDTVKNKKKRGPSIKGEPLNGVPHDAGGSSVFVTSVGTSGRPGRSNQSKDGHPIYLQDAAVTKEEREKLGDYTMYPIKEERSRIGKLPYFNQLGPTRSNYCESCQLLLGFQ